MAVALDPAVASALTTGGAIVTTYATASYDGVTVAELTLVGGSVTADRSASVQRAASLTVGGWDAVVPVTTSAAVTAIQARVAAVGVTAAQVDAMVAGSTPWTPLVLGALVSPGSDVTVGWTFTVNGTDYDFPLGVFRVASRKVSDSDQGLMIDLSAHELSRYVSRQPFTSRYTVAKGTLVTTAITDLLASRLPGWVLSSVAVSSETTPRIVLGGQNGEQDPWKAITDLADSIDYTVRFTNTGSLTVFPRVAANRNAPTAELVDGDYGTLIAFSEALDDSALVNGVIVEATNASTKKSIRVSVWDEDADSPANITLNGRQPIVRKTKKVASKAQAVKMATRLLARRGGFKRAVDVSCVPRPDIEVGDVVRVRSQRAGVDANYRVETITYPLDLAEMMLTLSRRWM